MLYDQRLSWDLSSKVLPDGVRPRGGVFRVLSAKNTTQSPFVWLGGVHSRRGPGGRWVLVVTPGVFSGLGFRGFCRPPTRSENA